MIAENTAHLDEIQILQQQAAARVSPDLIGECAPSQTRNHPHAVARLSNSQIERSAAHSFMRSSSVPSCGKAVRSFFPALMSLIKSSITSAGLKLGGNERGACLVEAFYGCDIANRLAWLIARQTNNVPPARFSQVLW